MAGKRVPQRLLVAASLIWLAGTSIVREPYPARAESAVVTSNAWARIPIPGLPGGIYQHLSALVVYRDQLYTGVQTGGPLQIWRSPDGLAWTGVVTETEFNASTLGTSLLDLAVVGDALYAATLTSGSGGAIWRTVDGESWEAVRPRQYPSVWYFNLASFQGRLYAHFSASDVITDPPSDQVLTTSNGVDWVVAREPDFTISSLSSVAGWLYVGGRRPSDKKPRLWRFDGTIWEDVSTDFQSITDGRVQTVQPFAGALYAVTTAVTPEALTVVGLWRSPDGRHWAPVPSSDVARIQAANDYVLQASLRIFRNELFLFTYDLGTGDVWHSSDGEHWEPATPNGWISGQSRGVTRAGAAVFNDRLWAGTVTIGAADDVLLYLPERLPLPAIFDFDHP